MDLYVQLYKASQQAIGQRRPRSDRKGTSQVTWRPVKEHKLVKLFRKQQNCSACIKASQKVINTNTIARKPLADLSVNTTKKSRSSQD